MPDEGIEPPTFGLQNRCTTAVLIRLEARLRRYQRPCLSARPLTGRRERTAPTGPRPNISRMADQVPILRLLGGGPHRDRLFAARAGFVERSAENY